NRQQHLADQARTDLAGHPAASSDHATSIGRDHASMAVVTSDLGVVIVTGGGRGIGAAISELAGTRGYRVVVNYSSDARSADNVVASVRAAGGTAVAVRGDVSSEQDVSALFDAAAELGPLAGLGNKAGITGHTPGRLDEKGAEGVRRTLGVNVRGTVLCAREAVRRTSTRP